MNEPHTKRGGKCAEKAKNQELKLTDIAGRIKSNFDWLAFQAIVIYWVLTWLAYPAFFGFGEVEVGMIALSIYFIFCSLISAISIVYIFFPAVVACHPVTIYQKLTALVLLLITIDNVVMAVDAITNPYFNQTLDFIDTIIQGCSDWFVPVGLSDILLIVILLTCLLSSLQRQEYR